VLSLLLSLAVAAEPAPSLVTLAEQSKWTRTGRYDEVLRLCSDFAKAYPAIVKCETFGTTPEGRPMVRLFASAAKDAPAILIQGAIHAGEIDGKDAGFWALREVLEGKAAKGALEKVTLLFVPVTNADGHERFGANNRPNQRGPSEMGWRTTAYNLNLNRDYAKSETEEMRAIERLLRDRDPIVYADLHVTNGADFRPDVAVLVDPAEVGPAPLREPGRKMRDALLRRLESEGHMPLAFYPSFLREDDPSSGFAIGVAPPRFSTSYWAAQNRFGILVETHSWKSYEVRVRATKHFIVGLLELASREAAGWVRAAKAADEAATKLGGTDVALLYTHTEKARVIDFPGYAYRRVPSAISGRMKIHYDPTKPEIWRIPFYDELRPSLTVRAPKGGYLIPPAHAGWVGAKLANHGIEAVTVQKGSPGLDVEVFRAREVAFGQKSYEGRMTASVKGSWAPEKRDVAAGSLWVPIAQRRARLVLHLFEPTAVDSFVSWGFFNSYFEQKEYMEAYVLEVVAEEMLAKDAALRTEFEKKLASEPAFQQSPEARLDFFYRRHPAYDAQYNCLPIYRAAAEPSWFAR